MKKGFTLIELMIVITILGILAAVAVQIMNPPDKYNSDRQEQQDRRPGKGC